MFEKIGMYIMSMSLLFLMLIIITIEIPICFDSDCHFTGFYNLAYKNITTILLAILLIIGVVFYFIFNNKIKNSKEIPFKIEKIESVAYENLSFLATYIIPLVTFDFSNVKYTIVFFMLILIMGCIYVRTNLFYSNPVLLMLGFRVYKVRGLFMGGVHIDDVILISKGALTLNDRVSYLKLDNCIYFVVKVNEN